MDTSQLPFLLQLLEDDSPKVRAKILEKLAAFGPKLESEIRNLGLRLSPQQREVLRQPLPSSWKEPFREAWLRCFEQPTEEMQLESAFRLIAEYQYGADYPATPTSLLDGLAQGFRDSGRPLDPRSLNDYLFVDRGLRGNENDYYNPLNSNLVYVIEEGRGIPISLACILILVGKRLGLDIHGCNVPGHFLARSQAQGREILFDCFSGGKILTEEEIRELGRNAPPGFMDILRTPPSMLIILGRILRNLIVAYDQSAQPEHSLFFRELLQDTQRHQQRLAQEGLI